eukprot:tig00021127_g18742.t1
MRASFASAAGALPANRSPPSGIHNTFCGSPRACASPHVAPCRSPDHDARRLAPTFLGNPLSGRAGAVAPPSLRRRWHARQAAIVGLSKPAAADGAAVEVDGASAGRGHRPATPAPAPAAEASEAAAGSSARVRAAAPTLEEELEEARRALGLLPEPRGRGGPAEVVEVEVFVAKEPLQVGGVPGALGRLAARFFPPVFEHALLVLRAWVVLDVVPRDAHRAATQRRLLLLGSVPGHLRTRVYPGRPRALAPLRAVPFGPPAPGALPALLDAHAAWADAEVRLLGRDCRGHVAGLARTATGRERAVALADLALLRGRGGPLLAL